MPRTPLDLVRDGHAEPAVIDTDTPGLVTLELDGEELKLDREELLAAIDPARPHAA